jgi:hypothetical protein
MARSHLEAAALAAPLLKAAGYTRRRNEFQRAETKGFISTLAFYSDAPGFAIQYAMVTPGIVAYRIFQGSKPPVWPSPYRALFVSVVFHPYYDPGDRSDHFPYRWREPYTDDERFTAQFDRILLDKIAPDLRDWTDTRKLVKHINDRPSGTFTNISAPRASALAWFDLGPSSELTAALAQLEPHDPVRVWITEQLAI